ncbi:hypothetical protein LTR84_006597 [Exophiala bonariae]|uniref:Ferric oxidoreductase domain-containing protein n=1 Tax=Exophiala bonariae TaxID=1690606 RepID=A0AAV9N0U1_9EURO|nr:hypothetical protein LTR84_006597 [Exophiala bonariae]
MHCARDKVPLSELQGFWEAHLATGTLSDRSFVPALPYHLALSEAQEEQDNRALVYLISREVLNETMLVAEDDFIAMYNYQKSFEYGEIDHGQNSIAVVLTAIAIPVLMSLSALLPYRWISRLVATLDQPLLGHVYRVPFLKAGTMPTRAQSLFFAYLWIINIVLMCAPLRMLQPNSGLSGFGQQALLTIGDRAGALAAANLVPLLLTSARNNVLLWITNWSNTTFLLTHRWLGYIVIIQTVLHSILLLHWYRTYSDYTTESKTPYWYWGIISTLTLCFLGPLSILPLRRRAYEMFLATHQILAALAMIAYFLHIWYIYQYNWGYEIWVYVAGAIWFVDRCLRILRIARNGMPTAIITSLGEGSDLLTVSIEGLHSEGHVYLYFPTMTWRFWENHPFSVLSSFSWADQDISPSETPERTNSMTEKHASARSEPAVATLASRNEISPATSLLLRPQSGSTRKLLEEARRQGGSISAPVWVEASYHSQSTKPLYRCSTLICIAGGVGITVALPTLQGYSGPEARLYWGVKHRDIVDAVAPHLRRLEGRVKAEIKVGERLAVKNIVQDEVLGGTARGDIGILVCGPPEMADHVRIAIGEVSRRSKRPIVFLDESFSW